MAAFRCALCETPNTHPLPHAPPFSLARKMYLPHSQHTQPQPLTCLLTASLFVFTCLSVLPSPCLCSPGPCPAPAGGWPWGQSQGGHTCKPRVRRLTHRRRLPLDVSHRVMSHGVMSHGVAHGAACWCCDATCVRFMRGATRGTGWCSFQCPKLSNRCARLSAGTVCVCLLFVCRYVNDVDIAADGTIYFTDSQVADNSCIVCCLPAS